MGVQEIAMVVGGILLLASVVWVANKIGNKNSASSKQ